MSNSTLCVHAGARIVGLDEVKAVPCPEATKTWFPVPHGEVVHNALMRINDAGFTIKKSSYALSKDDGKMFATFDVGTPLVAGVSLAIGLRNSIDKSLPLGFCAGSRVFVCDNLAFSAELLVKRKHTRHGDVRFREAIAQAVQGLAAFKEQEAARIERMMTRTLTEIEAESIMLRTFEQKLVSNLILPKVIKEWRKPTHDYGTGDRQTAWKLLNCFTTVLGPIAVKNPQRHADVTMALGGLLDPAPSPAANAA